jgi:hypothetical protein
MASVFLDRSEYCPHSTIQLPRFKLLNPLLSKLSDIFVSINSDPAFTIIHQSWRPGHIYPGPFLKDKLLLAKYFGSLSENRHYIIGNRL